MYINYFYAMRLIEEVHAITGIDFSENKEDVDKFRKLTQQEASRLRFMINVRPNNVKDYVYKNIINIDKPF